MTEVLTQPQFQVLTHQQTNTRIGRIYFPALFLAEYHPLVKEWLQIQEIQFDTRDVKLYGDGSFRIYFQSNSPKKQYLQLIQSLPKAAFIKKNSGARSQNEVVGKNLV